MSPNGPDKHIEVKNNLEIRLAESKDKYQRLQNEFDAVVNSTSWRMTGPLRSFVTRIRQTTSSLTRVKRMGAHLRKINPLPGTQHIKNHVMKFADTVFKNAQNHRNMVSLGQLAAKRQACLSCNNPHPIKPGEYPAIDIGIVTFNNCQWLPNFMNSLMAQQYPLKKLTLIVVDHNSSDGTLDAWNLLKEKYGHKFKDFLILSQENRGFGAGQNLAFSKSCAPYFLVSNVDLEFEIDALPEIVKAAIREGNVLGSMEFRQKPFEHPKYYDPVTFETAWSSHSCVLFRREALAAVGGYEKRIFMYGEDTELSYRLWDHGFCVKYCPKAVVWHYFYQDQDPEASKPLQFKGNTIANSFIRIRYGVLADILQIPGMYWGLIKRSLKYRKQGLEVAESIGTVLKHTPYFLATRKKSNRIFPFQQWDFEQRREGAFYKHLPRPKHPLPLVTIIIRTSASQAPWLREAVFTVAAQTYPTIEIVIIQEGDTGLKPLDEEFQSRYSFPVCCIPLPQKGVAASWNRGLCVARGAYLMFLDDTGVLFSDHVETLMTELINNPEYNAAYGLSMEINCIRRTDVNSTAHEMGYGTPEKKLKQPFDRSLLLNRNFIPIQSVLFHRRLYERHGGFDESMDYLEDWDLWLRYSRQNDFLYIEKTTSLFRTPFESEKKGYQGKLFEANHETIKRKHKKIT